MTGQLLVPAADRQGTPGQDAVSSPSPMPQAVRAPRGSRCGRGVGHWGGGKDWGRPSGKKPLRAFVSQGAEQRWPRARERSGWRTLHTLADG